MKFFQVIFSSEGKILGTNVYPAGKLTEATTIAHFLKEVQIGTTELQIGAEYRATIGDDFFVCVTFRNDNLFYLIGRNETETINLQQEIVSQNRIADLNMVRLLKTLDELNTAKSELEKVAKYREIFISNISHEMRTPLTAIIGFSEILSDMTFDSDSLEYLNMIKRSSDDLLVIINDLLDISQINSGKISITNKEFSTELLFQRAISSVAHSLNGKALRLELDVQSGFPPALMGDKVRLLQIITNLLNNAIKYSTKGKVILTVQVAKQDGKNCHVRLSVKDNGPGIPKQQIKHIFQEFYQINTATTTPLVGGIGLGLAITKRLVNLMDGKIDVKSVVGEGSEFIVTIPFQQVKRAYKEEQGDGGFVPKGTMLLIDDIRTDQKIVGKMLSDLQLHLQVADNATTAIEMLHKSDFDILFFNPSQQQFDWRKIVKEAKIQQGNQLPIVIITHAGPFDRKSFVAQGITDFISKPFDQKTFIDIIKKYISL